MNPRGAFNSASGPSTGGNHKREEAGDTVFLVNSAFIRFFFIIINPFTPISNPLSVSLLSWMFSSLLSLGAMKGHVALWVLLVLHVQLVALGLFEFKLAASAASNGIVDAHLFWFLKSMWD